MSTVAVADASPGMRSLIRPMGSFHPVDGDGWLVNDTRADHVPVALRDRLINFFDERFGAALVAVYVRGSVARGTAVAGVSDLDAFAVVADGTEPVCPHLPSDTLAQFQAAAPGLIDFELNVCRRDDVVRNYFSTWAFLVKTQSARIHGEDLAAGLQPYRVGPHLMAEAMYLPLRMRDYAARIASDNSPEQATATCQWMMKAVVRAAFDLTLDRAGLYTRDLYPCWQTFSQFYPTRADDCERALRWAIAPDHNTTAHRALVDDFATWIGQEGVRLVQAHGIDLSRYEL
jgi:uncharacterized protein